MPVCVCVCVYVCVCVRACACMCERMPANKFALVHKLLAIF